MFDVSHIQIGAGRYIQHHGALKKIGSEAISYGKRAFILIGDDVTYKKTMPILSDSLKEAGVEHTYTIFTGPCTQKSFDYIARQVKEYRADIIIGVGGGRILDIAKAAGDSTDVHIITVPTSAATCAAYAILYVIYAENGAVMGSGFLKHEISSVIVDTDIVAYDCPVRYLASGIADAMAKKPEFLFTLSTLGKEWVNVTSDISILIADYTYSNYLKIGLQAINDFKEKKDTVLLDDIICMNIMLTGLISDLSTGGKQLAIAHNFYDAICCLHKDIRKKFLHGELVGLALTLQIAVNGGSQREIDECREFMKKIGCPTCLDEIGFPKSAEKLEELIAYIQKVTIPDDTALLQKISGNMKHIM